MKKIVLASASPRRKKLLSMIGLQFEVEASHLPETIDKTLTPHALVKQLSKAKAQFVAKKRKNTIVIAADTLVVLKGKILGKPHTQKEAQTMLKKLSGNSHLVITGFTIIDTASEKIVVRSVESTVYARKLTIKEINAYVKTKEPLDKAGAYGIQGKAAIFFEKVEGDFFNVVGLPIFSLAEELKKFGIEISDYWE